MGVRWSRMSWSEKNELWQRWRRGETLDQIARALHRGSSSIYDYVGAEGGIAPRPRRRSRLRPNTRRSGRRFLGTWLEAGRCAPSAGRSVGRRRRSAAKSRGITGAPPIVRRRPIGRRGDAARRPQRCRLATRPALRRAVAAKLAVQWSPQQISGWLRHTFPSDPEMQVSHETIYRSLFIQSRGVLKRALLGHLRRQRHFRHARAERCVSVRSKARSSMPSRFVSGPRTSQTARCPGIGKAICWKAHAGRTWRRSSSGNRAMCCWSACRIRKRRQSFARWRGAFGDCRRGLSNR